MNIAFRVNVVDAQIILIANPLSPSSEAIVLGTKQILLAQQHALTLQVSRMGMFLCRMDRFEDTRLRILDDFSVQMSMDSSKMDLTSINIDIEPLVLRLSLRDILLALQIVSKASELSASDDHEESKTKASDQKAKQLRSGDSGNLQRRTASGKGASTMKKSKPATVVATRSNSQAAPKQLILKHEELTATLDGMRVILIGDLHELPILDLSIKRFTTSANDWSSSLRADTNIDMFINIYNFSKSTWEPLIEPWELGLQVAREQEPAQMSIDLTSPKVLELTLTSASIALASKSAQFLTQEEDVLSKPRGAEAPYRIRNYTGFDVNVWADVPGEDNNMAARFQDGEEGPWRFEDWEKMRENLTPENNTGVVGVRLEASGFDSVNKIPVNREGEYLYGLRPRKDQILHRLLVEITLGTDNVKYITFRSPLLVENKTQIPVELGVFDAQEGHLLKIEKIAPGESRPAPVGAAFMKSLLVRPDQGFGYAWSTETLWWRDLLQRPTRTLTCKGETDKNTPPFYFQMHASYDKTNPLTRYVAYSPLKLTKHR
jgi:vacuolar protein sorting-associated protein 13A/C